MELPAQAHQAHQALRVFTYKQEGLRETSELCGPLVSVWLHQSPDWAGPWPSETDSTSRLSSPRRPTLGAQSHLVNIARRPHPWAPKSPG